MEARIKKIFHRKKDHQSAQSLQQSQSSAAATSTPALRTSPYDSTSAGGLPQTGAYPIKGNNSSSALRKRKSSLHNRGHEDQIVDPALSIFSGGPHHGSRAAPAMSQSLYNDRHSSTKFQPGATTGADHNGLRRQAADSPPAQEFSALSLSDRQTPESLPQPLQSRYGHVTSSGSQYNKVAPDQIGSGTRDADWDNSSRTYRPAPETADMRYRALTSQTGSAPSTIERRIADPDSSSGAVYESANEEFVSDVSGANIRNQTKYPANFNVTSRSQPSNESDLRRNNSVPRKQLPSPTRSQPHGVHASSPTELVRPSSQPNQGQLDLAGARDIPAIKRGGDNSRSPGIHTLPRPISRAAGATSEAEDVINRAKSNTVNTEVIETTAPAVVHEVVHQDVHHVREEVITREIHTHEIYHRILPVIDVEVLPPRHFLPVEGGGLVEISASEAPGRGRNWVIAETASKIPSDQRAPKKTNRFSAREFVGDEGDTTRYMTREGFERSEETWVHPPELETGGRDTGQTWPMMFDDAATGDVGRASRTSRSPKKKSSSKVSAFPSSQPVKQV